MVSEFRLARLAERFVKEREKKGPTWLILQQCRQNNRSSNALSDEQLGSCGFAANMEVVRKKA